METLVRPASPEDMAAIAAIYGHSVLTEAASFEIEPPDGAEMTRRHAALAASGYPYLVGERKGRVAGYAYASAFRSRQGYRHTVEDSIYVAPDGQGQGIGGALLKGLIAECERQGFRQMIAVVSDPTAGGSLKLHAAHGFTVVGTYTGIGYKFGRWIDTVHMQRGLGAGATSPPTR